MLSSPLWSPYPQLGPEQSVSLFAKPVKIKISYMDLSYVCVELGAQGGGMEHRLKLLRIERWAFEPKRRKWDNGENCTMRSFMVCATAHQLLFGWSNGGGWDWRGIMHAWGRGELCTCFVWGKHWGRTLGKPRHRWGTLLKCIWRNWAEGIRIGTNWSCCEHGNEPFDSVKCGEFLDWLKYC